MQQWAVGPAWLPALTGTLDCRQCTGVPRATDTGLLACLIGLEAPGSPVTLEGWEGHAAASLWVKAPKDMMRGGGPYAGLCVRLALSQGQDTWVPVLSVCSLQNREGEVSP